MTPRRLIVRSAAHADILRYVRYLLEHDARAAAERFPDAVEQALERLLNMPGIGVRQTFMHPQLGDMRAWQVPGFSSMHIYYQEISDGIRVIRILHSKRNLRRIFSRKGKQRH
ncbi:MAG: type II toxin-antitoxin system RelE/ParE family toxin [Terriglobia bacterium]